MNKEKFEKPLIEVVQSLVQDIITASNSEATDMGNYGPWE